MLANDDYLLQTPLRSDKHLKHKNTMKKVNSKKEGFDKNKNHCQEKTKSKKKIIFVKSKNKEYYEEK